MIFLLSLQFELIKLNYFTDDFSIKSEYIFNPNMDFITTVFDNTSNIQFEIFMKKNENYEKIYEINDVNDVVGYHSGNNSYLLKIKSQDKTKMLKFFCFNDEFADKVIVSTKPVEKLKIANNKANLTAQDSENIYFFHYLFDGSFSLLLQRQAPGFKTIKSESESSNLYHIHPFSLTDQDSKAHWKYQTKNTTVNRPWTYFSTIYQKTDNFFFIHVNQTNTTSDKEYISSEHIEFKGNPISDFVLSANDNNDNITQKETIKYITEDKNEVITKVNYEVLNKSETHKKQREYQMKKIEKNNNDMVFLLMIIIPPIICLFVYFCFHTGQKSKSRSNNQEDSQLLKEEEKQRVGNIVISNTLP